MTDPKSDPSRVRSEPARRSMTETALDELAELGHDIQSLANRVRDRISLAGEESQRAWVELDRDVQQFQREVEREPEDAIGALRETGFALKRRLRKLNAQIKPT